MTIKELYRAVKEGLPVYVTTLERFDWQRNDCNRRICNRTDSIVNGGSVLYPYFVEDGTNKYFHATTAPVEHTDSWKLGDFTYVEKLSEQFPGVKGVVLHPNQVELYDPVKYEMTDLSQFKKTIMEIDNEGK